MPGHVRYVGMATKVGRPYAHAGCARRGSHVNPHLMNWIRVLQADGREPSFLVLEELREGASRQLLGFVEKCYIKSLREIGHRLTNVAEGGDGGNTGPQTPEALAKIRASWTSEKRAKQSRAKTGNKNCVGRVCSPETREKQRIAHLGQRRFGRPFSLESRAKSSASQKGVIRSAESRAKQSASARGAKRTPGQCETIRAAVIASWVRRKAAAATPIEAQDVSR